MQNVQISFNGHKTVKGEFIRRDMFRFALCDCDGNIVDIATNDIYGNVRFIPIDFLAEGRHKFFIYEMPKAEGGFLTDGRVYWVYVDVGSDGVEVIYPKGDIKFHNKFVEEELLVSDFSDFVRYDGGSEGFEGSGKSKKACFHISVEEGESR